MDAENPGGIPQRVEQRRSGIEYFVEHHCGFLYILTNSALCHNYRLVRCPVQTPTSKYWEVMSLIAMHACIKSEGGNGACALQTAQFLFIVPFQQEVPFVLIKMRNKLCWTIGIRQ